MSDYNKAQGLRDLASAVESGEYKRATSTLRQNTRTEGVGYCCLGLLCHLTALNHPELLTLTDTTVTIETDGSMAVADDHNVEHGYITPGLSGALGLTVDQQQVLGGLNDSSLGDPWRLGGEVPTELRRIADEWETFDAR